MNWQKVSIERLKVYEERKRAVESIPEQIKNLKTSFGAIRAASNDATAVKGGGNTREDALISNIVMREELKKNYKIAISEIRTTEKGLNVLTKEQRLILDKFYICRTTNYIEDLCEELCVERSRIYTLKDEALKRFTISCYGVVEI